MKISTFCKANKVNIKLAYRELEKANLLESFTELRPNLGLSENQQQYLLAFIRQENSNGHKALPPAEEKPSEEPAGSLSQIEATPEELAIALTRIRQEKAATAQATERHAQQVHAVTMGRLEGHQYVQLKNDSCAQTIQELTYRRSEAILADAEAQVEQYRLTQKACLAKLRDEVKQEEDKAKKNSNPLDITAFMTMDWI